MAEPTGPAATDLETRLRDRIAHDGPIPWKEWMATCLYDPQQGYYMRPGRKTGPGPDADFATSPTLHPFMAEAVAREVLQAWQALGRPAAFQVVEFGGGEGDLARDALAWLDAHAVGLAGGLTWTHVETSPTHRERQRRDDATDRRVRHTETMPACTGLVVAHEFLDALPFHWLVWDGVAWQARQVGHDGTRFCPIHRPADPGTTALAPVIHPEVGQSVVVMDEAREWLHQVRDRLHAGRVLVVDYGDEGRRLWTRDRPDGTVRGFRRHRLVEDVLGDPGDVDITASVDFTRLAQWADEAGFQADPLLTQEMFLVSHGALERLAAMPQETVEDASAYLRLKQMVLAPGMGGAFKVLRLHTPPHL